MNLKYFMRGLGMGIIVTATLLMVTSKKQVMSKEDIIKQAKLFGMVMKTETDINLDAINESLSKQNGAQDSSEKEENSVKPTQMPEEKNQNKIDKQTTNKNNEKKMGTQANPENEDIKEMGTQGNAEDKDIQEIETETKNQENNNAITDKSSEKTTDNDSKEELETDNNDKKIKKATGNKAVIEIKVGTYLQQVAELLHNKKLISNTKKFVSYVRKNGNENLLKVGKFNIPKDATYDEIIDILFY